jgi:hypothetical protein
MRLPSRLLFTALMLAAPPALLFAQSSGLASTGQSAAGPVGSLAESPAMVSAPAQLADAATVADQGPIAAPAPATSIPADNAAGTPPAIEHVSIPEPEAVLTTAAAPAGDVGPSMAAATSGIRANTAKEDLSAQASADRAAAAHQGGLGTGGVLMIVGGAALLAGLLIGGGAGTAIAVAGAVAGLYGLYLYLQ